MNFKGKRTPRKFNEHNLPRFSEHQETPNRLLIYEVNGKFVHEELPIQPETIKNFKAINKKNYEDINRNRIFRELLIS